MQDKRGIIAVKLEKNAHKGIPDYMFIRGRRHN